MSRQTIWITGAKGNIGKKLVNLLKKETDYKVLVTDKDVDVSDHDAIREYMNIYRPNIVVNCASISGKEACEENKVEAYKVNAIGARNLAMATNKVGASIIHFSTDDVFTGKHHGPINEFDFANPKSVYGKSKLAGENFIRELNPKHLIIRSSWVYGISTDTFFSKVLEAGKNNDTIYAATNEFSTPTSDVALARFVVSLIEDVEYGVYHVSNTGSCSRYEFAREILINAGYNPDLVIKKDLVKDNYTILDSLMMQISNYPLLPDWKEELKNYMEEFPYER